MSVAAVGPTGRTPGAYAPWVPWIILGLAAAIRLLHAGHWSLWLDEETSVYFALNPDRPFPRSFPLYFWLLGGLFQLTGVSIVAARVLTASIGVWTLWLLYRIARRFCGQHVAVPALVLLSLSIGHLFWSQSIRYYVLLFAFQLLSIEAFLSAIERPRIRSWVLATLWLAAALATHLSAILLLPVYAVFIGWLAIRGRGTERWFTAAAVLVLVTGVTTFLWLRYEDFAGTFSGASPMTGLYVIQLMVLYAGVPAVALAMVGVFSGRRIEHAFVFFFLLASVPILELVVIGSFGLWWAFWYHGFVALAGLTVLGGYGWHAVVRYLPRRLAWGVGAAAICASSILVAAYHTTAHGDRSRWEEAALAIRDQVGAGSTGQRVVLAQAPGVIAHYLGVPPDATMGSPAVRQWAGLEQFDPGAAYLILRESELRVEALSWLRESCQTIVRLPARMVTRDRTVVVFFCPEGGLGKPEIR